MEKYPVPSEIVKCLDSIIIGQSDHKQKLAVGLYNHCISIDSNAKDVFQKHWPNNMFIVGPKGLGKEQLFINIAALLNVPYAIYDCNGIKAFDIGKIAELLKESALVLYGDEYYNEEFKIPTCIVYLDNIDLTDWSFYPNMKDLVVHLQRGFEGCSLNTEAKKILFVCVISPTDDMLYQFERCRNELRTYVGNLINRPNIAQMIEKTHSCTFLSIGLMYETIIRYRQLFEFHKAKLVITDEAAEHMSTMQINKLNDTLDHIFSLAMYQIPGSNTNVVQVTLETITEWKCPNLIEREM